MSNERKANISPFGALLGCPYDNQNFGNKNGNIKNMSKNMYKNVSKNISKTMS